ncbi:hypothetical protein ACFL0U_02450 [Pseudomonadota bacterium]
MGTKNNPKNRGKEGGKKIYQGRELEPVMYYGKHAGHGSYMSARFVKTNDMLCDKDGKPLQWSEIIDES